MKWLLLALIGFAVYHFGFNQHQGEFDAAGNAKAVLFVSNGCPPCDEAVALLTRMKVEFELLTPFSNDEAKQRYDRYRTNEFPLLVIGDVQSVGFAKHQYIETYAKAYGLSALAKSQQALYEPHFDGEQPKVVMYGTDWCGYCKKARGEFADNGIDFVEWNVEQDSRANARFKQLGGTGYPLIYVGLERMHEFDKSKVNQALAQR